MAEWTASLLPLLPLDVLHLVGLVAHPSDLCSMLLVNKALNKTLTSVLYSSIELDAWDPILKCIETLSTPSKKRSFGRVLEKYLRSLVIKRPVTRKPSYASGGIGDALLKALPLMVNLKHFSSGVALSPCSSNIFYLLATGSCPSLQSIELQVLGEVPTALEGKHPNEIESEPAPLVQAPPRVNLRRLALELPVGSAAQRSFVRQLLRTCAPTLRSLSLTLEGRYVTGIWEHFLPPDAHFARLEDLTTDFEALSAHPPFQRADAVRSLTILRSPGGGRGGGSLSADVLPGLRSLSCPAKLLPAFLPAGDSHRRPVATVRLGKASYRSYEDDGSSWRNGRDLSTWRDVFGALQHLRYSAVPVTSLTVDVASIPVAGVQAAQPYLASLGHLDIVLHRAYEVDSMYMLATELLARLPRLHTLLISHAPPTRTYGYGISLDDAGLSFAESMWLSRRVIRELEDKPSVLRRLAFSADIEWHKNQTDGPSSGWHWSWDPRYYRDLRGSLDDPDPSCVDGSESEFEDEAAVDGTESVYSGPSDDGTVYVDSGYEDDREDTVEEGGHEDDEGGASDGDLDAGGADDGYGSEASEEYDTRFLPDGVLDWRGLPYAD